MVKTESENKCSLKTPKKIIWSKALFDAELACSMMNLSTTTCMMNTQLKFMTSDYSSIAGK